MSSSDESSTITASGDAEEAARRFGTDLFSTHVEYATAAAILGLDSLATILRTLAEVPQDLDPSCPPYDAPGLSSEWR